jgi:hypothetical protein
VSVSPKAAFLALAVSVAAAAPAHATGENPWTLLSPWTLSRAGYFFQTTASFLSTSDFYDAIGEKQATSLDYKEFTTNLHLEYGLRNSIGLLLHIPLRDMKQQQPAPPDAVEWGFGDLTLGSRWRLKTDPVVASIQAEVKLPTGYNSEVQQLPLGEGQADLTGRLLLGKTFPDINGYALAAGGYRARKGDPANQFLFNADGGAWLATKFLAEAHWEYEKHSGDGTLSDRMQGGLSGRYRGWRSFDAVAGVFHTFGGQSSSTSVPAGTQVFLGLTYRGNRLGKFEGPMAANLSETPLPEPPKKKAAVAPAPRPAATADTTQVRILPPAAPEAPAQPDTTKH